jgi:hypothetical protein
VGGLLSRRRIEFRHRRAWAPRPSGPNNLTGRRRRRFVAAQLWAATVSEWGAGPLCSGRGFRRPPPLNHRLPSFARPIGRSRCRPAGRRTGEGRARASPGSRGLIVLSGRPQSGSSWCHCRAGADLRRSAARWRPKSRSAKADGSRRPPPDRPNQARDRRLPLAPINQSIAPSGDPSRPALASLESGRPACLVRRVMMMIRIDFTSCPGAHRTNCSPAVSN